MKNHCTSSSKFGFISVWKTSILNSFLPRGSDACIYPILPLSLGRIRYCFINNRGSRLRSDSLAEQGSAQERECDEHMELVSTRRRLGASHVLILFVCPNSESPSGRWTAGGCGPHMSCAHI
jgi:hypothetical protein